MDKRYAIIRPDNKAINFILWDGVSEFNCGEGNSLVLIEDVERYGFGWIWDGNTFIDPMSPTLTQE